MGADISVERFDEGKHYEAVILQQGKVLLDKDWNTNVKGLVSLLRKEVKGLVGHAGGEGNALIIGKLIPIDTADHLDGWSAEPPGSIRLEYYSSMKKEKGLGYYVSQKESGKASIFSKTPRSTKVTKKFAEPIDISNSHRFYVLTRGGSTDIPINAIALNDDNGIQFSFSTTDLNFEAATDNFWWITWFDLSSAAAKLDLSNISSVEISQKTESSILIDLLAVDHLEVLTPWDPDMIQQQWSGVLMTEPIPETGTVITTLDAQMRFRGKASLKVQDAKNITWEYKVPRLIPKIKSIMVAMAVDSGSTELLPEKLIITGENDHYETSTFEPAFDTSEPQVIDGKWKVYTFTFLSPLSDIIRIKSLKIEGFKTSKTYFIGEILAELSVPPEENNFLIIGGSAKHPVRFYVDGILCLNEFSERYLTQQDYPEPPLADIPAVASSTRSDLVYLDIWQRDISYIIDPSIKEVALHGPDTTARIQTVCQVKIITGDPNQELVSSALRDFDSLRLTGEGRLTTGYIAPQIEMDPCAITPSIGYTGIDNRLYRIEIHDPGNIDVATFKWSKDNGSIAVAVAPYGNHSVVSTVDKSNIQVESLGKDKDTSFKPGDYIEISDDVTDLSDIRLSDQNVPVKRIGEIRRLTDVDTDRYMLSWAPSETALPTSDPTGFPDLHAKLKNDYKITRHAKVRKWDGIGKTASDPDSKKEDGSLVNPQLDLDDGVKIRFDGNDMKTGDYWTFTTRALTHEVERLVDALPIGTKHHYAKIAEMRWTVNTDSNANVEFIDLRKQIPYLTDLRATDVTYQSGMCATRNVGQNVAQVLDNVCIKLDCIDRRISELENELIDHLKVKPGEGNEDILRELVHAGEGDLNPEFPREFEFDPVYKEGTVPILAYNARTLEQTPSIIRPNIEIDNKRLKIKVEKPSSISWVAVGESREEPQRPTPSITLNPEFGNFNTSVKIHGQGFTANSRISLKFERDTGNFIDVPLPAPGVTDSNGIIESSFRVPETNVGTHRVIASDANGLTAETVFKIQIPPVITFPQNFGIHGELVKIVGRGFTANSRISLKFERDTGNFIDVPLPAPGVTDSDGVIETRFNVPLESLGRHRVRAIDANELTAESEFFITQLG